MSLKTHYKDVAAQPLPASTKNPWAGPRFKDGATFKQVAEFYRATKGDNTGAGVRVGQKHRDSGSKQVKLAFIGYDRDAKKPLVLNTVSAFVNAPHGVEIIGSGQFGCTFDCVTCESASSVKGPGINQSAEQVFLQVREALKGSDFDARRKPFRLLLTGEGDDGVNAAEICEAIRQIKKAYGGLNFVRVSTAGAVGGVKHFIALQKELQVLDPDFRLELQLSLHATRNDYRAEFAPKPVGRTIEDLLKAGAEYYRETGIPVRLNFLTFRRNFVDPQTGEIDEAGAKLLAGLDPDAFYLSLVPANEARADSPAWSRQSASEQEIADFTAAIRRHNPAFRVVQETDYAALYLSTGCGQATGNNSFVPVEKLIFAAV